MHLTLVELAVDLVNNAVAAAPRLIEVTWSENDNLLRIGVTDDGRGMTEEVRRVAVDPFFSGDGKHPGRRVGLGIPFMIQTAEATEGRWWLESEAGRGTRIGIELPADHVDLPPVGDIAEGFCVMLWAEGDAQMRITRSAGDAWYVLDRNELVEVLGDIRSIGSIGMLREYVRSQEESIWAG